VKNGKDHFCLGVIRRFWIFTQKLHCFDPQAAQHPINSSQIGNQIFRRSKEKSKWRFSPTQWSHFHRVHTRKPLTHTHSLSGYYASENFFSSQTSILEHKKAQSLIAYTRMRAKNPNEITVRTRSKITNKKHFLLRKYDLTVGADGKKSTHTRKNEAFL
jgi:hypothetical protein